MQAKLFVRLTGQVTIVGTDGTARPLRGRQSQVVLAMLALEGGQVSAEAAAEVLWGDALSPHWRGALRGIVSKLRTTLVTGGVATHSLGITDGMIRLDVPITTNVSLVERLVTDSRQAALTNSGLEELRDLSLGLRLPFLAQSDSTWADAQRHRITALLDGAEHSLLDELRARGALTEAIHWAEEVVARDPVDSVTRTALVEMYLEINNVPAAIHAFGDLERMLASEFDLPPDPILRRRIKTIEPASLDFSPDRPPSHHPHADEPFVGRDDALASIDAAWRRVNSSGVPELVLVHGPAGIGKSRLADLASVRLSPQRRLWGRSRPSTGQSWGPFADALTDFLDRDAALAHQVAVAFPNIELLVSETLSQPDSNPIVSRPDADRRVAALGAARRIAAEIGREPTVLVLDDLHWTGPDGIAILDMLLHEVTGRILVLATTRDISDPLAELAATAARHDNLTDVALEAFTIGELTDLVRHQNPERRFTDTEIAKFHGRTGGLPYFVAALIRDSHDTGRTLDPDRVPQSVALWLESHLRALTGNHRRLLEIAAVFGTSGDLAGVEAVADLRPIEVADTLDELSTAGLITIDPQSHVRIPHDLTQRAVWQSIGRARRATLHRLVGDYLEMQGAAAYIVAVHWSLAGPARHESAARAHLRAGDAALARGAWSAALEHFGAVRSRAEDPELQTRALIGSGWAQIQLRGYPEAREMLESAADLAEHHGLDHAMAEATLLLVGRAGRGAILDDEDAQITRLRAVRRRLRARVDTDAADPDVSQRTNVLLSRIEIELAISLLFTADLVERQELLSGSLTRIRRTNGASANDLASALLGQRMGMFDPADLGRRLNELDEVLALPHAQLDAGILIAARIYQHEDLLRLGRSEEAKDALAAARSVADRARHAYWRWAVSTWEALGVLFDGHLAEADQAFSVAAGARSGVTEALACHQVNLVGLRLLQQRGDEMFAPLQFAVEAYPQIPTYRAALALTSVEAGSTDEAAALLEPFTASGFANLPEDTNRFFALGILAHVAATVGSLHAASALWDLLEPYREQLVLLNCYGGGGACWGPVEWALARIAPLVGRTHDQAAALWIGAIRQTSTAMPVLTGRITAEAAALGVSSDPTVADRSDRSESTS